MSAVAAQKGQEIAVEEGYEVPPVVARFLCSSSAACLAESVTFPIDTTRVRIQSQGLREGMVAVARDVVVREGPLAFYSGVGPALARQFCQCGVNLGSYTPIRNALGADRDESVLKKGLAGAMSGSLGQFCALPTDIVKVRMQGDTRARLAGGTPQYRNGFHCFREVVREGGVRGLWRGATPSCLRSSVIHSTGLASYDASKTFMTRRVGLDGDRTSTHVLCSAISGVTTSFFGCPLDVIKTRVMNHADFANITPRQIFADLLKREGAGALFRGFIPTLSRMGPWQVVWLTCYEKFCVIVTGKSKI